MLNDKLVKEQVLKIADELNIESEVAIAAYRSFWDFIFNTINDMPKFETLEEEEFNNYRKSFNIPSIGKLHDYGWDRLQIIQKNIKDKRENEIKNK